jgi:hypothetical protein
MTETEWLVCEDPLALLKGPGESAGARKLRLFACACCRLVWWQLGNPESREAVEAAERFVEGEIPLEELTRFRDRAYHAGSHNHRAAHAAWTAAWTAGDETLPYYIALTVIQDVVRTGLERRTVAYLMREVVGHPFRPVQVDPSWLRWNGGTVAAIARGVYDERAFDRMPVLADALEDAGCADAAILSHCRSAGHVRGCWLLDALLDR